MMAGSAPEQKNGAPGAPAALSAAAMANSVPTSLGLLLLSVFPVAITPSRLPANPAIELQRYVPLGKICRKSIESRPVRKNGNAVPSRSQLGKHCTHPPSIEWTQQCQCRESLHPMSSNKGSRGLSMSLWARTLEIATVSPDYETPWPCSSRASRAALSAVPRCLLCRQRSDKQS